MKTCTLLAAFRTLADAMSYRNSLTRPGYRPMVARSDFGTSKGFPFFVISDTPWWLISEGQP